MIRRPGRTRGRVSSGFPFTPKNVSGLAAWYAADSLTTTSSPNQVSGLVSWFRADSGITKSVGINDFSSWSIDNTDALVPNQLDPTSGFGAYLFRESTATTQHTFYSYPNTTANVGGTIVFSVTMKYSGVRWVQIHLPALSSADVYVDVQNGVLGTVVQGTNGTAVAALAALGNGWYQVTITQTVTTSTPYFNCFTRIYLTTGDNVNAPSFVGDGASGVFVYNPTQTMTIGQRVSGWADQAPGADATHNLAQVTTAKQPTLTGTDSAYGSQATLAFASAASEYLTSPQWTSSIPTPYSIVLIGNYDGTASTQVFCDSQVGAATESGEVYAASSGQWSFWSGAGFTAAGVTPNANPTILGTVFGAAATSYVSSNKANASGNSGTLSFTGMTLGSYYLASNFFLNGTIAEVMIYNRALTQAEIQALEMYAASRYGLPISIGTMNDKSGTGDPNKNLAQATQTKQPTIKVSDAGYNGKASLSLAAAATQWLVSGTWTSAVAQPYTAFAVGNSDGTTAGNQYFVDGLVIDSGDLLAVAATSTKPAMYAGTLLSAGTTNASPMVLAGVFNGASSALYQSAKTPVASGAAGASGRTGITLGAAANGSGGPLNGKITEVLVYSRALSANEINKVLSFLGKKYGIAIGS